MECKWNYIEKEKPICTETGNWDGKRSEQLIVKDYKGDYHIAYCYEGFMDGSAFCEFYSVRDWEIEGVTHWAQIPEII